MSFFISPNSLRCFCDIIIDSFTTNIIIKNNRPLLIFCFKNTIKRFFTEVMPCIQVPFILITHNSDYSHPSLEGSNPNPEGSFLEYLSNPLLLLWACQNCNVDPKDYPKMLPIPIGVIGHPRISIESYYHLPDPLKAPVDYWSILYYYNKKQKPMKDRQPLIHAGCWHVVGQRKNIIPTLPSTLINTPVVIDEYYGGLIPEYEDYIKSIGEYQFILSPMSNGMDCYRSWEALTVGTIPIVQECTINSIFNDLPVIIVRDYTEITRERLDAFLVEYSERYSQYNFKKLYTEYWIELIRKYLPL